MKRYLFAAVTAAAMTLGTAAHAGPVIIDGTDSADHGGFNGSVNTGGWQYMQRALENLGTTVSTSVAKVVTVIGTATGTTAGNAINSAFTQSNLFGSGWSISFVNGASAITSTLTTLSTSTTGILYLSTASAVTGDMDTSEMAAVNGAASQINSFVSGAGNPLLGGALFSQGETGTGAYGWLSTLIPGIIATDVGGGGIGTDISLTAAGSVAFPSLTNADLALADPWHGYFSGNLGGLSVLGTALQNGVSRNVIIGGGAGTVLQCGQPGTPPCQTPEPGSMVLMVTAGLALLGLRRRRLSK